MRTIACLNWKGGSGKSTTALALAVGIARRLPKRQRVLLVDNDPQANSTMIMLDGRTPEAPTLADVLLDDADAIEAIRPTRVDGLDILPADGRLADCTVLLADELGRERRLRVALRSVEDTYSVCVVEPAAPVVASDASTSSKPSRRSWSPSTPACSPSPASAACKRRSIASGITSNIPDLAIVGLLLTRATKNKVTGTWRSSSGTRTGRSSIAP